jgi:hypothetical protein
MNPYGCHNRPRPVAGGSPYMAQEGWRDEPDATRHEPYPTRLPVMKEIRHVMSTDCMFDASATDPRCAGCIHALIDVSFDPDFREIGE